MPTLDQQRDALQKGLGRALQWAFSGQIEPEPLLSACLRDQRFDIQIEGNRGEWLWEIIKTSGLVSQLRHSILEALRNVTEERNDYQLCELALYYGKSGDDAFVRQLYEFVEKRQISASPEIGMGQLLRLGGETGFRTIINIRGEQLAQENWQWYDDAIVEWAIEEIGEERVRAVLDNPSDSRSCRFATRWRENLKPPSNGDSQRRVHVQKMKAISVDEVIHAAATTEKANWLRGWGMQASESDLEVVQQRLSTQQQPKVIANLLRVFSNRPLPHVDARLIELCHHADQDVRRWTMNALEHVTHPLVREFALTELQERRSDKPIVGLFIKNYQECDDQRLLDQLQLPEDLNLRHWMLMDLTKVLEQNESADCLRLGQIIYFHTPCESCRFYAAKLLNDRQVAPEWLTDECRLDSNEDCRSLFDPSSGLDELSNEV
jgi:hypothetical protein